MRALNITTIIRISFSTIIYMALAISFAVLTTGCPGDKKSGVANTAGPGPYGGCPTCSETNILYSAVGRSSFNNAELSGTLHGVNYNTSTVGDHYTGEVSFIGTFVLGTALTNFIPGCEIPAGRYAVNTTQTGTMDGIGTVWSLQADALGPVHLRVTLNKAMFDQLSPAVVACDGGTYFQKITYGEFLIERADVNCGYPQLITFVSPQNVPIQCL